METDRWKINMFGRLSAQRGTCIVTHFRREKTGLLLACLAQQPHRSYRREELVERIWPDQALDRGRNSLRVALSSLRERLETRPEDRNGLLIADRYGVHLKSCRLYDGYVRIRGVP